MERCEPTQPALHCTQLVPAPENPDLQIECCGHLDICEALTPDEHLRCPRCGAAYSEGRLPERH